LHPTFQVRPSTGENIEIDPKSVRTNFELAIVTRSRRIGLEKYFRDVAVPEFVTTPVRIGGWEQIQLSITALKPDIQVFAGP
jgi:hypothetical protein